MVSHLLPPLLPLIPTLLSLPGHIRVARPGPSDPLDLFHDGPHQPWRTSSVGMREWFPPVEVRVVLVDDEVAWEVVRVGTTRT